MRDEIHERRTAFWNRARRAVSGFIKGDGSSIEELGGAVVSDFLLWGDIRDLAKQGWNKATGKETDPVVAGLAAVGVLTSVASYVPDPAEGAEVSADASFSLLKTLRKTGHLSKKFCGVLVDGCRQSVKAKSLTKGMKEIVVGMKGLFDRIEINEGMLVENVVAQMLRAAGRELYFYSNASRESAEDRMEIDFLLAKTKIGRRRNIIPIEVKSGKNYTTRSLDKFRRKFRTSADTPVVLHPGDLKESDGVLYLPLYATPFL